MNNKTKDSSHLALTNCNSAKMRIRSIIPYQKNDEFENNLSEFKKSIFRIEEENIEEGNVIILFLIEPAKYREVEVFCKQEGGKIEVVTHCVKSEVEKQTF
jgi:hypothetical protein